MICIENFLIDVIVHVFFICGYNKSVRRCFGTSGQETCRCYEIYYLPLNFNRCFMRLRNEVNIFTIVNARYSDKN